MVVASHPRSGTHLCIDALRLNLPDCASWKLPLERADRLYLDIDRFREGPDALSPAVILKVLGRIPRPIIKTHAYRDLRTVNDYEQSSQIPGDLFDWLRCHATFVYTYRDGRDALCSYYQLEQTRLGNPPVTLSQFLRHRQRGVSRVKAWAQHVESWVEDPAVYCVTMRELLQHCQRILPGIAEKLGCAWDRARRPELPPKNGFDFPRRLRRRLAVRPRSTAVEGDPRLPAPKWRTAFTREDREFFLEESGDLLVRLGYEDSDHWADPRYDEERRYPALFALEQHEGTVNPPPRSPAPSPSYSTCYG